MDILKAEIARKRKLLEEKEILGNDRKYFKRGELIAKEQEEYRKKYYSANEESDKPTKVTVDEEIDSDVQHSILPRHEVISRLRDRSEPILLFGETELDAFKRLRKYELLEPEVDRGFRNDLQEAMEQVDQVYLNELLKTSDNNKNSEKSENKTQEPTITYEEIREMAKKMGRGNREHDMTVIVHFVQDLHLYCRPLLMLSAQAEDLILFEVLSSSTKDSALLSQKDVCQVLADCIPLHFRAAGAIVYTFPKQFACVSIRKYTKSAKEVCHISKVVLIA